MPALTLSPPSLPPPPRVLAATRGTLNIWYVWLKMWAACSCSASVVKPSFFVNSANAASSGPAVQIEPQEYVTSARLGRTRTSRRSAATARASDPQQLAGHAARAARCARGRAECAGGVRGRSAGRRVRARTIDDGDGEGLDQLRVGRCEVLDRRPALRTGHHDRPAQHVDARNACVCGSVPAATCPARRAERERDMGIPLLPRPLAASMRRDGWLVAWGAPPRRRALPRAASLSAGPPCARSMRMEK